MIDGTGYVFAPPSRNLERAAFFIAGQAIVARSQRLRVRSAVVMNDGRVAWINVDEPRLPHEGPLRGIDAINARRIIRAVLGGPVAQADDGFGKRCVPTDLMHPDNLTEVTFWRAVALAAQIAGGNAVLAPLWREVQTMLFMDDNWAAVTVVAESLTRDGELSGTEIAEIANTAIRGSAAR